MLTRPTHASDPPPIYTLIQKSILRPRPVDEQPATPCGVVGASAMLVLAGAWLLIDEVAVVAEDMAQVRSKMIKMSSL